MRRLRFALWLAASSAVSLSCAASQRWFNQGGDGDRQHRNFIIFVTDGLRAGSVNKDLTPTLAALRDKGVTFTNSHSLFPTFTTANASAIATGHYLGDTGDFSNTVYVGYPIFSSGSIAKKTPGTEVPFLENDAVIADVDEHFQGNFLSEESLLAIARGAGYQTAAVGKLGPVLLQDATESKGLAKGTAPAQTIIIDDATGSADGVPLSDAVKARLTAAKLALAAPKRDNGAAAGSSGDNGFSGDLATAGTTAANVVQQQYFADTVSKVILPLFKENAAPFGLVFWSRDPDGSQHNQGDSLGKVVPGINGPTSKAGIHNADDNLKQVLAYLNAHPDLAANTDIFVTADHGFSTISHLDLGLNGEVVSNSYAQSLTYRDASGRQEVQTGALPAGFLAIDIAHALNLSMFDPDDQVSVGGVKSFKPVDPTIAKTTDAVAQRPRSGNALIGGTGSLAGGSDAQVVVAANGGSDLIYIPGNDAKLARKIVQFLATQDYVSGLFTNDALGEIPGALPMSTINMVGTARLPLPAIVVNFRTFATDPTNPVQSEVEIADSSLQTGQGMHGSFGRGDTFNNMIAFGPDFKAGYVDPSPVGNADVAVTLAHILGLSPSSVGKLMGRVLNEALRGGAADDTKATSTTLHSLPADNGLVTILNRQEVGTTWYFDAAGFAGRTVGLTP